MQIAPSIRRIGDGTINSYLVEEAGEVTVVDAGMPGFYQDLPNELAAMGRRMEDIKALVLTHGHSDHIGFAERLRTEQDVPVSVHELDAALARGEADNPAKGTGPLKPMPFLRFLWLGLRNGGFKRPIVHVVSTFGDGATLDVPGSLHVILVPGHTPGSAALYAGRLSTLFVGDALATYAVTTGKRGPQVAPFTADAEEALQSLSRIERVPASLILPGHGEPWTEGAEAAVRRVREAAASSR